MDRIGAVIPEQPPSWVLADNPRMCPLCLDTGVIVEEFHNVAEYCNHYRCQPEELTEKEKYWLSDAYPYPLRMARPCSCMKSRAQEERFRRALLSLVSPELGAARLEGIHQHIDYKVRAFEVAKEVVARALRGERGFACFEGETGTGKTYVALGAVRGVTNAGAAAAYVTSCDFCNKLREHALGGSRYVDDLKEHDLIVLDDVGAERIGPAEGTVRDQYERFLKSFERTGVLLVTTNYDLGTVLKTEERFGPRANTIIRRLKDIEVAPAVRFGS